jgi:gamma-glutamyl phosphate reductase
MKAIAQIVTALSIFAVAGVLYLAVQQAQTYVRNEARHQCAQDFRLEYADATTNTTVVKPIDDLYQQCLSDKGV